ncbi:MAG: Zn-dependent hydrolase, partial [Bacteroidota bacterium]
MKYFYLLPFLCLALFSCQSPAEKAETKAETKANAKPVVPPMQQRLAKYIPIRLTTDVSKLSDAHKKMIPLLIEAGKIMDELFWYEAYGDGKAFLKSIDDPATRRFAEINYGPWDRLDGNKPFLLDVEAKPAGANFYPTDMSKAEFDSLDLDNKKSLYTFIRRNDEGQLVSIPYHVQFKDQITKASELLGKAAALAENDGLQNYLQLRSQALLTDDYQASDMAWLDMKTNTLDVVMGPIETYEDQLYGYKAAHEAYVLVKDMEWSQRLARYAAFLPDLQAGLPADDKYKQEKPGRDTELNAYDVIYYAGDCNAGSKTIAINLPNDEEVQLTKGTRRLQLKNAMKAKFDKIL